MYRLYKDGTLKDYLRQFTRSGEYLANFTIRGQEGSREQRIVIRSLTEVVGKGLLKKVSSNLTIIGRHIT